MNQIIFNSPIDFVVMQERKKTFTAITITEMIDNPIQKTVAVMTKEIGRIVLWKDQEYDNIGQWTDSDVIAKITQLYQP